MVREIEIEKYLMKRVKDKGGLCWKFTSGLAGMPDRIVMFPGGKLGFLEVKKPGSLPRALQIKRITQINRLGFFSTWVDTKQKVDEVLNEIYS